MVMRGINEQETCTFTIYLTIICNHNNIIHKSIDKEAYIWVGIFFPCGRTKKTNARVLKDVIFFLSNHTRPSNSTQQWGMKPPKEVLVKDEVINYNEG
jgi:hypothetical protein